MSGDRMRRWHWAAWTLFAAAQVFNAMMQFRSGDLVSGTGLCALASLFVLMMVGVPDPNDRQPLAVFSHGWRHHKALIAIGLFPVGVGVLIAVRSPKGWLDGLILATVGACAVFALLFHRYRRRDREAVDRPRDF